MKLRDYQIEDKATILEELSKGQKEQLIVQATGLGKTVLGISLMKEFPRCLWLTHKEELIDQSSISMLSMLLGNDPTVEEIKSQKSYLKYIRSFKGNNPAVTDFVGVVKQELLHKHAQNVVASVPTMVNRLHEFDKNTFDIIICDEAHLFMAKTFLKVINHFKPKLLVGLTATPTRLDGAALGTVFGKITVNRDIKWGIDNGWLVEIEGKRIKTSVDLSGVRKRAGEFATGELEKVINIPERNRLICKKYKEYLKGKQAIFYAVDVQHALDMESMCIEEGISCVLIVGDENICPNRQERFDMFKTKKADILINVEIATTGFDYDMIEGIIMGSPTMSLAGYLQKLGRGTRTEKGVIDNIIFPTERIGIIKESRKPKLLLLDIVDNTRRHQLINAWNIEEGKKVADMAFLSTEQKERLIKKQKDARKLMHSQKVDESVNLMKLPVVEIYNKGRNLEPATPKQLAKVKDQGYDIKNNFYTKYDASVIISAIEVNPGKITELRQLGFDAKAGLTLGQYQRAKDKWELQNITKKRTAMISKLEDLPFIDIG